MVHNMPDTLTLPSLVPTAELIESEIERDPRLKSAHTRRSYKADLLAFETWRAGRPFTRLLVEEYAAGLQQAGRAPDTINRALAAIRWWARRLAARIQEQPALSETEQRLRAEMIAQAERAVGVRDVRGSRLPKGRHISAGELSALMQACENDPTPAGARDAALIALAWCSGARREELAGLALSDYVTSDDEGRLRIHGKGDKMRTLYIYDGAFAALADWLKLRGDLAGPLFCAINKGGSLQPAARLSGEALRLILEKRIEQARLQPLTWHDFRRTFAGNLLDNGQDLATVQRLMGHTSPLTTSEYDRRGEEVKRRAVRTLFVPYRGRL